MYLFFINKDSIFYTDNGF